MKTTAFLLAALFTAALGGTTVSASAGEEPDPEQAVEAFHAALAAGNRTAALDLLDPEVVIFEAGHAELSRDAYAAEHLDADIAFSSTHERRVGERRAGVAGDTAWVLTRTTTVETRGDSPVERSGVETMILRRTERGWRVVHIHWS